MDTNSIHNSNTVLIKHKYKLQDKTDTRLKFDTRKPFLDTPGKKGKRDERGTEVTKNY